MFIVLSVDDLDSPANMPTAAMQAAREASTHDVPQATSQGEPHAALHATTQPKPQADTHVVFTSLPIKQSKQAIIMMNVKLLLTHYFDDLL